MPEDPKYTNLNGTLTPFAESHIHVLAPGVTYAANVFEGIRGYWNPDDEQLYLFRLDEHLERLQFSMHLMGFDNPPPPDKLKREIFELVRANGHRQMIYVRVMAYIDGDGAIAATGPVAYSLTSKARGNAVAVTKGARCLVSSWQRIADNAMPARVKASGNYTNSRLAMLQAKRAGFDTAIMLTERGTVAEGPAQCLFAVVRGTVVTPGVTSSILESITRDSVIELAAELDYQVVERDLDRSELYLASEVFFAGTGQEVAPVVDIDGVAVGTGSIGPVTTALQKRYFEIVEGRTDAHPEWRLGVY